jgi:hypothetical protein
MAKLANEAVILDRYLFRRLLEQDTGRRPVQPEHLLWLLELMDSTMLPTSRVVLLADDEAPGKPWDKRPPSRVDAAEVADTIRRLWRRPSQSRIAEVQVVVGPWKQRGAPLPHDRHLRFNVNSAIGFPQGLDRLSTPTITDPDGLNWHHRQGTTAMASVLAEEARVLDGTNRGFTRASVR